jgi:arylsulfatase A-like enzyme
MSSMNRREFVTALGAAAASITLSGRTLGRSATEPATRPRAALSRPCRRPNIILIYTDDMDFHELGVYGSKVLTPHMDSIARDGMLFTRAYVVSAVCTPSRFNVVTGQYATRCHSLIKKTKPGSWPIISWNQNVTDEQTLPKMLKRAGYRTGMVGKWHLNATPLTKLPPDPDPKDPEIRQIIKENYDKAVASVRSAGFDYADAIYNQNAEGIPLPEQWVVHNQDWVTARALEFIEQNKEQPFYLYFASTIPHSPSGMKSLQSDPRITTAGLLDKPLDVQPSRQDVLRRTRAAGVPDRDAFLTWLDDGIGAIFRKLDDLGLSDDTLVLFMSDNGNVAKYTCYEGGANVPAMARWPGRIQPGGRSDAIVCNLDLVATVLDVSGAKPTADDVLDGRSLLPILEGRKPAWRDHLLLEVSYSRAIVTQNWKYVAVRFPPEIQAKIDAGQIRRPNQEGKDGPSHYPQNEKAHPGYFDADQLYDLKQDPKEKKNLAADPRYKAKLDEMKALLKQALAPLPLPFGEFKQ